MGTPYIISDMNGHTVSTINNGTQRHTYCLRYISNEPFNPGAFPVEIDDNINNLTVPQKSVATNPSALSKRAVTNAISELEIRDNQQDS